MGVRELFGLVFRDSNEMTSDSATRHTRSTSRNVDEQASGGLSHAAAQAAVGHAPITHRSPTSHQTCVVNASRPNTNNTTEDANTTETRTSEDKCSDTLALKAQICLSEDELTLREAQIRSLQEALTTERSRNTEQASSLQAAQTQIQTQDTQIRTLNRNLHNLQVTINTNANTATLLQNAYQDEKNNIKAAIEENDSLRQNLEDCKEQIFKMQPMACLTDSQIGLMYSGLCDTIQVWVATTFADIDDGLMTLLSGDHDGVGAKAVKMLMRQEEIALTITHPVVDNNILGMFVLRYLHETVLKPERIYPGVNKALGKILDGIMNGMKTLDPPRDDAYIQMWRVDMYRSLQSLDFARQERREALKTVFQELLQCLQQLMPGQSVVEEEMKEVKSMVMDAWDLAKNIRESTGRFEWKADFQAGDTSRGKIMRFKDLKSYDVIDVSTGQPVRASSIKQLEAGAKIGEKLCTVRPALVRKGKSEDEDLLLLKATIMVEFDREARQEKKKAAHRGGLDKKSSDKADKGDARGNGLGHRLSMASQAFV